MNTELRKNRKNGFKKESFKIMNNTVFKKTMIKKCEKTYRDIKLVTTKKRRNYLVSGPNCNATKFFSENLLAIEMKKETQKFMNKPLYLGLSILEIRKIVMYEFWYGYVKPKHGKKLNYVAWIQDSFIAYIKAEDIYADIAKDVETRFDTLSYELDRPLSKEKKQGSNWSNERWNNWEKWKNLRIKSKNIYLFNRKKQCR